MFFVIISGSCTSNTRSNSVWKQLQSIDENIETYNHLILIPNEGCSGCLKNATVKMFKALERGCADTLYIFYNIKDKKRFKVTVFDENKSFDCLIVDHDNLLVDAVFDSIYPLQASLEDAKTGQFSKVE